MPLCSIFVTLERIQDHTIHKEFINWVIIKDAYLIDIQRQK